MWERFNPISAIPSYWRKHRVVSVEKLLCWMQAKRSINHQIYHQNISEDCKLMNRLSSFKTVCLWKIVNCKLWNLFVCWYSWYLVFDSNSKLNHQIYHQNILKSCKLIRRFSWIKTVCWWKIYDHKSWELHIRCDEWSLVFD